MNIIHIITSLKIGGAERFVIDLCELQSKKNLNVQIVSFGKRDDPLNNICEMKNIRVKQVNGSFIYRNIAILKCLFATDVIHIHSPYALKAVLLPLVFLFYKKIIYTRHGEASFASVYWKSIHKLASLLLNHVTFVSEKGKDVFTNIQKLTKLPHHVIENGANTNNIEIIERNKNQKLFIGSVGRMVKLKHQISLVSSLLHLKDKMRANIEIHFFGDGECLDELQQFCQNNQLDTIVTFHGVITDRNLIYNNFDVLVVTSETEGLSLAIIEAMAYSRPVLATDVGGNPKLVLSGKTGFLFEYNNEKKLAHLIEKIAVDRVLLKELGDNSKKYINENYSLNNTAKKYMELYF